MYRIREYIKTTWLDIHDWSFVTQAIIVAGICLPILILLGYNNGHIKQMGDEIRTSPTACKILASRYVYQSELQQMKENYPHVQAVIPLCTETVTIRNSSNPDFFVEDVTLNPTVKGDPSLRLDPATNIIPECSVLTPEPETNQFWKQVHSQADRLMRLYGFTNQARPSFDSIDIQQDTDETLMKVVLSDSVLEKLNAEVGDDVVIEIERDDSHKESFSMTVAASYKSKESDDGSIPDEGYAAQQILVWIWTFRYGDEVDNEYFKWPSKIIPAKETYSGFMMFTDNSNKDLDSDLASLRRNSNNTIEIGKVSEENVKTLYGLLSPEKLEARDLGVYFIRLEDKKNPIPENGPWFENYQKLYPTGSLSDKMDPSKDLDLYHFQQLEYIPWNAPLKGKINGNPVDIYGVSCNVKWFKNCYKNPNSAFLKKDLKNPEDYFVADIDPDINFIPEIELDFQGNLIPLKVANYISNEERARNYEEILANAEAKIEHCKEDAAPFFNNVENCKSKVEEKGKAIEQLKKDEADKRKDLITAKENKEKLDSLEKKASELRKKAEEAQKTVDKLKAEKAALESSRENSEGKPDEQSKTKETLSKSTPDVVMDEKTSEDEKMKEFSEKKVDSEKDPSPEATKEDSKKEKEESEKKPSPLDEAEKELKKVLAEAEEAEKKFNEEKSSMDLADPESIQAQIDSIQEQISNETTALEGSKKELGNAQEEAKAAAEEIRKAEDELNALTDKEMEQKVAKEKLAKITKIYVPAELLAQMHSYKAGKAQYSKISKRFLANPDEPRFPGMTIYADDIDNVSELKQALNDDKYDAQINDKQIVEMKKTAEYLATMTMHVSYCILFFGFFTVFFIIGDSTSRKYGMIGILRVMGTSRFGILFFVLLRSTIMSVLAVVITLIFSSIWAIAVGEWLGINMIFKPFNILLVSAGIFFCGICGSFWPAFRASRIDPIEAIQKGKTR